jgi:hypothetical protein
MAYWIVLSTKWTLQDVQAGLNVVVQVLCILAIFVGVQWFWQSSALKVARGEHVPVSSVLSINTPGEVWDATALLRTRMFRHPNLLIESLLVIILGITAIFAGPIARFNTNQGTATPERLTDGLMASRDFDCKQDNVLATRDVWQSLDNANFTRSLLLDFLPDVKTDWEYSESDWSNSSWSAECDFIKPTNVTLRGTGVYNGTENWPVKFWELDGLWGVLDEDFKENGWISTSLSGNRHDKTWLNVIMWIYAVIIRENDMRMALVSVYLKDPPTADDPDEHTFGVGPVPEAYYTKSNCVLTHKVNATFGAYPDVDPPETCFSEQASTYFYSSALQSTVDGTKIFLPSGEDIFRWYQSYLLSKDTHHKHPNERILKVRIPTVEVTVVFLALASLVTLFVLAGLLRWLYFQWRYHALLSNVPETKVEWVLYSHKVKGRKGLNSVYQYNVDLAPKQDERNLSWLSLDRLGGAYKRVSGGDGVSPELGRNSDYLSPESGNYLSPELGNRHSDYDTSEE